MISPIKILVGEILEHKVTKERILVTGLGLRAGHIYILNLENGTEDSLMYFRIKENYLRHGYIGNDVLAGEDWLCHDNRCFPSSIAGCCTDCPYSNLTKQRKQYFSVGDDVYDPKFKSYHKVTGIILGGTKKNGETINSMSYKFSSEIDKITEFYQLFRLSGFSRLTYFRYNEIRLVKRTRFIPNTKQLEYICGELCLFGKSSEKCKTCKTGEISYDIQGNC